MMAKTEAGQLIDELMEMARRDPNPGTEHFAAFLVGDKPRAREIGQRLYELGGIDLMLMVHDAVVRNSPPASGRHLEIAWDFIGEWRA